MSELSRETLEKDKKNLLVQLRQARGDVQRAEKKTEQAVEDAQAQRAVWLRVETEKREARESAERFEGLYGDYRAAWIATRDELDATTP